MTEIETLRIKIWVISSHCLISLLEIPHGFYHLRHVEVVVMKNLGFTLYTCMS